MKNFSLFLVLLLSQTSFAQKSEPAKHTLLYEVSGMGLKKPSYIFGTYHLLGKSFLDTLPAVIRCLNKTESVIGEIIMPDEKDMIDQAAPYLKLKETTLDQVLSSDEYRKVDSVFSSITGQPGSINFLNEYNPAGVNMIIAVSMSPIVLSPSNPGLDSYFQKVGKESGKTISGLETIEEQFSMLFNDPVEKQKQKLIKFVNEFEKNKKLYSSIMKSYTNQDLETLIKEFEESEFEDLDKWLYKRNQNWSLKLPDMMKKQACFIAVGAGHLPGEKGILNLLERQGYTVVPVDTRL